MSKSKEEIESKVRKFVKDGFQHDYDREDKLVPVFKEEEVIENILMEMDQFAKSQCIAFVKWKDDRGYLPFQKPDSTTPEWGWKRQENQIIWSKWINDDQLYDLYLESTK